jgi:hypothetical protein
MRWLFGVVGGCGLILWIIAAAFAETLQQLGPRWMGMLTTVGPTLAVVGLLLFAMSEPIRRQAQRLRHRQPRSITLVCQRTPDLRNGLVRVPGVSLPDAQLPGYLVLQIEERVDVWSSSTRLCSFDASLVEGVRCEGESTLVLTVAAESGLPAVLTFKVGRDGWELWPERRSERLTRLRQDIAQACRAA